MSEDELKSLPSYLKDYTGPNTDAVKTPWDDIVIPTKKWTSKEDEM